MAKPADAIGMTRLATCGNIAFPQDKTSLSADAQ